MKEESWVTALRSQDDLEFGIALQLSLKTSSRKLIVLIDPALPKESKECAQVAFDLLVPYKGREQKEDLKDFLLKSFPLYEKLICLPVNTLAFENLDHLFSIKGSWSIPTFPEIFSVEPRQENCDCPTDDNIRDAAKALLKELVVRKFELDFSKKGFHLLARPRIEKEQKNDILEFAKGLYETTKIDWINPSPFYVRSTLKIYLQPQTSASGSEGIELWKIPKNEGIAVIGISLRLPGASNLEEIWDILMNRKNIFSNPPESRLSLPTTQTLLPLSPSYPNTRAGYLAGCVECFDAMFFGISPSQAAYTDPQQRLLFQLTWESLEDAGINPQSINGSRTSIFVGEWATDYAELMKKLNFGQSQKFRKYMGNSVGSTAGKLSQVFGTTGVASGIEAGCTSSLIGIGAAMSTLREKRSDLAIAAGVNLILEPYEYKDYDGMVSPSGESRPFSKRSDGFVRSEGVCVLILKRLSDAVQGGDHIYGVLRGYGSHQEGLSSSMGTPTVDGEAGAMTSALEDAGLPSTVVTHVEAHGTGTIVGDPLEVKAIEKVYRRSGRPPLLISSIKGNIGHTESASGLMGLVKTLLSFKHNTIPPIQHSDEINEKIELGAIPGLIPREPIPWGGQVEGKGVPRVGGVSSFGLTGTNAHLIVEEGPTALYKYKNEDLLRPYPLTISAKSESAFTALVGRYQEFLGNTEGFSAQEIARASNVGRGHFSHRALLQGSTVEDFLRCLDKGDFKVSKLEGSSKGFGERCILLFTGQGPDPSSFGRGLYRASATFRRHYDEVDEVDALVAGEKHRLLRLLFSEDNNKGELLKSCMFGPHLLFAGQIALSRTLEEMGIVGAAVVGHSVGEIGAAVVSGFLSLRDALRILEKRRELLCRLGGGGGMVALLCNQNIAAKEIQDFLTQGGTAGEGESWIDISVINSDYQTRISGPKGTLQRFQKFVSPRWSSVALENVEVASHSRALDPILQDFRVALEGIEHGKNPRKRFISSVEGLQDADLAYPAAATNSSYWLQNLRGRVDFPSALKSALSCGIVDPIFLEVGPNPTLCSFVPKTSVTMGSMRNGVDEWDCLIDLLSNLYHAGADIKWEGLYRGAGVKRVPAFPHYPFQEKRFWFKHQEVDDAKKGTSATKHPFLTHLTEFQRKAYFQGRVEFSGNVGFASEHKLGQMVLYPGAGYLEICGQVQRMLGQGYPLVVRDLRIEAAIGGKETDCFNIFSKLSKNSFKLYSCKDGGKWRRNFSAVLVSPPSAETAGRFEIENLSVPLKTELNGIYERIGKLGYAFGPNFRSLRNVLVETEGYTPLLFGEVVLPGLPVGFQSYTVHPILIDGMMQGILLSREISQLKVPIRVKKFTIHKEAFLPGRYFVYVKGEESYLLDEEGEVRAALQGLEAIPTTLDSIQKGICGRSSSRVNAFEEIWCPSPPRLSRISPTLLAHFSPKLEEREGSFLIKLESYIGQQLFTLFEPTMREKKPCIHLHSIMEKMNILEKYQKITERFLEILLEDGYIEKVAAGDGDHGYLCITGKKDEEAAVELEDEGSAELELTRQFLPKMGAILKGDVDPLAILFPLPQKKVEEAERFSAQTFYKTSMVLKRVNEGTGELLKSIFSGSRGRQGRFEILEIGAGTGATTAYVLEALTQAGLSFNYTFTDLSSSFFPNAKERFAGWNLNYKCLNIEEDGVSQGFKGHGYDIIVAGNVLHATVDIRRTVAHVAALLAVNGLVVLQETWRPTRYVDISWGLLEGYWRFKDKERSSHCTMDFPSWKKLFEGNGMEELGCWDYYGSLGMGLYQRRRIGLEEGTSSSWVLVGGDTELGGSLVHQLPQQSTTSLIGEDKALLSSTLASSKAEGQGPINILYLSSTEQSSVFGGVERLHHFLTFLQSVLSKSGVMGRARIFVFTRATTGEGWGNLGSSPIWGMSRVWMSEVPDIPLKLVDLPPPSASGDSPSELVDWILHELSQDSCSSPFVSYRAGGTRLVKKLRKVDKVSLNTLPPLPIPPHPTPYSLAISESKSLDDLSLKPLSIPSTLEQHSVRINVSYFGLNFKDVFNIKRPTGAFSRYTAFGGDWSGFVSEVGEGVSDFKIGDPVMGLMFSAPSSCMIVEEKDVFPLPASWSLAQGATVCVGFATAIYSLLEASKIRRGDTVLIHTGSGGVGLAAIQVAKLLGANIFATAGSERKRNYLKEIVGIQHVFSSRDTSFSEKILQLTKGQGVSTLLNTLTGKGFKEAGLAALNKNGGYFVELSKLNTWSTDEVKRMAPNVRYKIVDLSFNDKVVCRAPLEFFAKNIQNFSPLPYTLYKVGEVRDGLKYLEAAKHIGKVICEFEGELFNDRSSYVITGGLSGIGIQTARWMSEKGAKYFLLVGRHRHAAEDEGVLKEIARNGGKIAVILADVSKYAECRRIFDEMPEGFPPIRGVIHSAGALEDGIIKNQTEASFRKPFEAKMYGSWNLHLLTKDLLLEFFVLYSTIGTFLGPIGQVNHAGANTFLDALAHHRVSLGLPALSINWGQWGEFGVAKDMKMNGITRMSSVEAFELLEQGLRSNRVQLGVGDVNFEALGQIFPWIRQLWEVEADGKRKKQVSAAVTVHPLKDEKDSGGLREEDFWKDLNSPQPNNVELVVKNKIKSILSSILQLDPSEIEPKGKLLEMGLDSLHRLELSSKLGEALAPKIHISSEDIAECSSLDELTSRVLQLGNLENGRGLGDEKMRLELIREDCELCLGLGEKVRGKEEVVGCAEISVVLLTGASGFMGQFMLSTLLKYEKIKKIYCMVREKKVEMDETGKIQLIYGDVGANIFGLSPALYEDLASRIDGVIHCAGSVNHLAPYALSPNEVNPLRSTNVVGTRNVLRFAAEGKLKWIYYASSVAVSGVASSKDLTNDASFEENWLLPFNPKDFEGVPHFGYPTSKYIGEQIIHSSQVPCKIFRLPVLMGGGVGPFTSKPNHLLLFYAQCFAMGMIPKCHIPLQLMTVDSACEYSLKVFFSGDAPQGVYNVLNPHTPCGMEQLQDVGNEIGILFQILGMIKRHKGWDLGRVISELTGGDDGFGVHGRRLTLQDLLSPKLRSFLRLRTDFKLRVVETKEFVEHLLNLGADSFLFGLHDLYKNIELFEFSCKCAEKYDEMWAKKGDERKIVGLFPSYLGVAKPGDILKNNLLAILQDAEAFLK